ncbi:MAG: DarT ssDNA thymidine ADP-ribosyltransferase family protein [Bryobacteraceae bacterium]
MWRSCQVADGPLVRGNAGAYYTRFFNKLDQLDLLDWDSIQATDWRDPDVKEAKQSEFLLENSFPWHLVERIGVIDNQAARAVSARVATANHRPCVEVVREWYY